MSGRRNLTIDDHPQDQPLSQSLTTAKDIKTHPTIGDGGKASIYFVGTATTILEWKGVRSMTDLPRIDVVLLSHYHADYFDEHDEASLRRSLPIITTPHAKDHLTSKGEGESFTNVLDVDFFQSMFVDIALMSDENVPAIKLTGNVPPGLPSVANDLLSAVPPTNGWMLELGYKAERGDEGSFKNGYRIYISGNTLMVDELKEIPERCKDQNIDLMLIHLGGSTIPSPKLPLLMVTMDAKQGLQLMQLIKPDATIPNHYDDYDVFLSPLDDFKKVVHDGGMDAKVVHLERSDQYQFSLRQ